MQALIALLLQVLCLLVLSGVRGRTYDETPDEMRAYAGKLLDNGRIMDLMEYWLHKENLDLEGYMLMV